MCVLHVLWHPCFNKLASQGGCPRLETVPVASFLLVAEWPVALGSIMFGFQFHYDP